MRRDNKAANLHEVESQNGMLAGVDAAAGDIQRTVEERLVTGGEAVAELELTAIDHDSDWWIFYLAGEHRELLTTSYLGSACASDDHHFHLVAPDRGPTLPVFPVTDSERVVESDATLVFARGVFRHERGDPDGAWADWTMAGALGMDDAQQNAARISESSEPDRLS